MSTAGNVRKAADMIAAAARDQYDAEPRHEDFYALALAAEQVLDALFTLNSNVGVQLARYGTGRRLRTDTDRTPAQVIDAAMDHGRALDNALRQGRRAAHAMAGECARLAFQPDPEPEAQ
jgi:hypothetical protein